MQHKKNKKQRFIFFMPGQPWDEQHSSKGNEEAYAELDGIHHDLRPNQNKAQCKEKRNLMIQIFTDVTYQVNKQQEHRKCKISSDLKVC